jgi:phytoene dehydrogenase-like protein
VHYVGLVDKGQSTAELYEGLGIANDLLFFRMNANGYEHCWIGDERIDMPAGADKLYESLALRFPKEKKRIAKYLKLVQQVSHEVQLIPKMNGFWDNITIPFRTRHMGKFGLFSLKRVIGWHIKDPLLRAILNVQCGDHGLPPFKASFPVHCVVMYHYLEGAFYPMGGGGGIVKAMTTAIKRHGGEVRTRQNVQKILVKDNTAYGVQLVDGSQLMAKNILSNADPSVTYLKMVGRENISAKLAKKLDATRYSVTSLILFLTLDMDVTKAGIDSGNIWMVKQPDLDKVYSEMTYHDLLEGDEFAGLFISCTTLKDPASFNGRYHNFEVVTFIDYECFRRFETTGDYHTPEYAAFKTRITEKLMNSVERAIPGARQHLVQAELGTPMTNRHYINSTNGNVYGTEKSITQVGPFSFRHKSEIANLYLCGASTLSHGVGGATHSGVSAAAVILNCKKDDLLQPDKTQNIRVYNADDSTTWPTLVHQKREDRARRFKEI